MPGDCMRWTSLGLLLLQNAITPLVFRLATTEAGPGDSFDTAAAVTLQEGLKLALSLALALLERRCDLVGLAGDMRADLASREALKLAVPAGLYFLQNCLLQVSAANLPAAVFQILYQGKTLTVALCSVCMLGRGVTRAQWLAIVVLAGGIAAVHLDDAAETVPTRGRAPQSFQVGALAALAGCVCSGVAGVYFERMMKPPEGTPTPSMWLRNAQLAAFSLLIGAVGLAAHPPTHSLSRGFTPLVWLMVGNNALGGLLTAMVIKWVPAPLPPPAVADAHRCSRAGTPTTSRRASPPPSPPCWPPRCASRSSASPWAPPLAPPPWRWCGPPWSTARPSASRPTGGTRSPAAGAGCTPSSRSRSDAPDESAFARKFLFHAAPLQTAPAPANVLCTRGGSHRGLRGLRGLRGSRGSRGFRGFRGPGAFRAPRAPGTEAEEEVTPPQALAPPSPAGGR